MKDSQALIRRDLRAYLVPGKTYPGTLPEDLQPWYCYVQDGGHSLYVGVASGIPADAHGEDIESYLAPVPVRTVLRLGVSWRDEYPICDVPYSEELGVLVAEEDDEY